MDESLRPNACAIAQRLRSTGRRVDLVLEDKRFKWAFKVGQAFFGFVGVGVWCGCVGRVLQGRGMWLCCRFKWAFKVGGAGG